MRIAPVSAIACTLAAAILVGVACAAGDRESDVALRGFMVLDGPRAAELGFAPGDTLVERPAARVPAALRQEVEREARRVEYKLGCTRYFGSDSTTVVFAARHCDGVPPDFVDRIDALFNRRSSHYWSFVLMRRDGDRFVPVRWPGLEAAIRTMCPVERDRRGRPSRPC